MLTSEFWSQGTYSSTFTDVFICPSCTEKTGRRTASEFPDCHCSRTIIACPIFSYFVVMGETLLCNFRRDIVVPFHCVSGFSLCPEISRVCDDPLLQAPALDMGHISESYDSFVQGTRT